MSNTISLTDPAIIIAGIRQFGLAPDGSDLRDLVAAIERLRTRLSTIESAVMAAVACETNACQRRVYAALAHTPHQGGTANE